jgi:hypothetical protein
MGGIPKKCHCMSSEEYVKNALKEYEMENRKSGDPIPKFGKCRAALAAGYRQELDVTPVLGTQRQTITKCKLVFCVGQLRLVVSTMQLPSYLRFLLNHDRDISIRFITSTKRTANTVEVNA